MTEERLAEYMLELITEIDFMRSVRDGQAHMIRKLHGENREHVKEIARLRKALEFYADEKNHTEARGTNVFGDVFYDKGKTAREALGDGD